MLYSTYPRVVDSDFSPYSDTLAYQDPFDKTFMTDAYTAQPDYSVSNFFNSDPLVDQPPTSTDMLSSSFPKVRSFNPTLPATGIPAAEDQPAFQPSFYQAPFEQLPSYQPGFSLDPSYINSIEPGAFSPMSQTSRTPSVCGDGQQQEIKESPWLSPRPIKRESISRTSLEDESTSKPPQRKRGRPRIERGDTGLQSSASSSTKGQRSARLPHNQVERKYREGLNAELERLRKAVPILPQSEVAGGMGQPKPSKAMVLAGAIDYIKRIEKERDALLDELDQLKQFRRQ
ncbi:hypothetical protein EK21DRAFT_52454 [Setomelanomma holmii]|uniref:BHLH domain-containing protein n=1 Tax=Setomelanomma holmii TaxID=210430 RepID=A0A9P4LT86_9PLEO|nr:hypothetical protein EK21DRAFT_52454 [Setomelanomma holmii]